MADPTTPASSTPPKPNLLLLLAKAIGLLIEESGKQNISIDWLGSPKDQTLALHGRRKELREVLTALFAEKDKPEGVTLPGGDWLHLYKDSPIGVVVSSKDDPPLCGLGARYIKRDENKNLTTLITAHGFLLGTTASPDVGFLLPNSASLSPQLCSAALFKLKEGSKLSQIELGASLRTDNPSDPLTLDLTLTLPKPPTIAQAESKKLTIKPGTWISSWQTAVDDAVGLALFLLKSLITNQRIRQHLFPLFGEKDSNGKELIPSFPISVFTQGPPALLEWLRKFKNLLPSSPADVGNIKLDSIAALLFHLRGLLTGSDDETIKKGSWIADLGNEANRVSLRVDGVLDDNLCFALLGQTQPAALGNWQLQLVADAELGQFSLKPDLKLPTVGDLLADPTKKGNFQASVAASIRGPQNVALRLQILPKAGETCLLDFSMLGSSLPSELSALATYRVARAAIGLRMQNGGHLAPFWDVTLHDAAQAAVSFSPSLLMSIVKTLIDRLRAQFDALVAKAKQQLQPLFDLIDQVNTLIAEAKRLGQEIVQLGRSDVATILGKLKTLIPVPNIGPWFKLNLSVPDVGAAASQAPGLFLEVDSQALGALGLSGSLGVTHSDAGYGGTLSFDLDLDALLGLSSLKLGACLRLRLITIGTSVGLSADIEIGGVKLSELWQDPSKVVSKLVKTLAMPLLLEAIREADFLKDQILATAAGAVSSATAAAQAQLGSLLQSVGLGSFDALKGTFNAATLSDLQKLTIADVVGKGLAWLLQTRSFTTGPVTWTIFSPGPSNGDSYGFKLGGTELSVADGVKLGWSDIQFDLLNKNYALAPKLTVNQLSITAEGPAGLPLLQDPVSLQYARVGTSLGISSDGFSLQNLALKLKDLRLPLGDAAELAGQLLPKNGKDNSGITLCVDWKPGGSPAIQVHFDGLPKLELSVDRQVGPLDLRALILRDKSKGGAPTIGLIFDGRFYLGGVAITPDGLGVDIPLEGLTNPKAWTFALNGLGLLFNQGGVNLTGLLRRDQQKFQGAALVRAFNFSLGAIGAYEQLSSGDPSLFVFGALRAPLGGPPFFFVTGVAGGMGYNRKLKVPTNPDGIAELPFFELMRGTADFSKLDTVGSALDKYLTAERGTIWLAGGVTFVSFQLIRGEALLYMVFGRYVELGVVAMARFDIENIVFAELALLARFTTEGDDPNFLVMGGLTSRSWLLTKDCRLHGGFAFQVWFASGDCVLTVGGYHPKPPLPLPAKYPQVERVGFDMRMGGVVVKGDSYFALTPREAMGGARMEVSGQWGPIFAGFTAFFDALIAWDPFYFVADIGVEVYCGIDTFFGRAKLSVGVALHLHGPPIGGTAYLKVLCFNVAIPFGEQAPPKSLPLSIAEYLSKSLGLTAQKASGIQVRLPGRSETKADGAIEKPGLFAIEVDRGLVSSQGQAPIGTSAKPFRLRPEFSLRLRSRIPVRKIAVDSSFQLQTLAEEPPANQVFYFAQNRSGAVDSQLRITRKGPSIGSAGTSTPEPAIPLFADLPEGLFGETDRATGAPLSTDSVRRRCIGVTLDGSAHPQRSLTTDYAFTREYSTTDEEQTLPLTLPDNSPSMALDGSSSPRVSLGQLSQLGITRLFATRAAKPRLMLRTAGLQTKSAALAGTIYPRTTLTKGAKSRRGLRKLVAGKLRTLALFDAAQVPSTPKLQTSAPQSYCDRIRVPAPRLLARHGSLAAIKLHVESARPQPTGSLPVVRSLARGTADTRQHLQSIDLSLRIKQASFAAGSAVVLGSTTSLGPGQRLQIECARDGSAAARVLCLGHTARPLLDQQVMGSLVLRLPKDTRRVFIQGCGQRASGFDSSTHLHGLGAGLYVGPGCTLQIAAQNRFDDVPGTARANDVLAQSEQVEIWLAAPPSAAAPGVRAAAPTQALILRLTIGERALENSVSWIGGRRLPTPACLLQGNEALLVFAAPRAPFLRVLLSLQHGWRLRCAALRLGSVADQLRRLSTAHDPLVDEHHLPGAFHVQLKEGRQ